MCPAKVGKITLKEKPKSSDTKKHSLGFRVDRTGALTLSNLKTFNPKVQTLSQQAL
jgi:hypothetical protein